jgi:methyl-accepting chemotaxis protein
MSNVSSENETGNHNSNVQSPHSYNVEHTAQTIKDIARRIREESAKVKDTVRILRQSGAIEELTEAVKEVSLAARDTSREISATARELKERGVIRDSAVAIDATAKTANETAQTISGMSQQAKDAAPEISAAVSKGLDAAKEKIKRSPTGAPA